jgi:tetratricopeptide (TPR) repeat protein
LLVNPALAIAHNNLGILLIQRGSLVEGVKHLREALRLKPGNPDTEYNLALALNQQQRWSEAAALFGKNMGRHSDDPDAHYQFGVALAREQKTREAMGQFAQAILLQPNFPDALAGLSWILATDSNPEFRNGVEAIRMAEQACELKGRKDAEMLKTLACAYAEAARFEEAISTVQVARDFAAQSNQIELSMLCGRMLETFKSSKPWRDHGKLKD